MTEIRQFATWDDNRELQIRKWVLLEDFERLAADAAGERAERESWRRLVDDREATIGMLKQDIERLRAEIALLQRQSSDYTSIEEHIRGLSWRQHARIWVARFQLRRALRRGWKPTIHTLCPRCLHPIVEEDHEACVCIECGGRNTRLSSDKT